MNLTGHPVPLAIALSATHTVASARARRLGIAALHLNFGTVLISKVFEAVTFASEAAADRMERSLCWTNIFLRVWLFSSLQISSHNIFNVFVNMRCFNA